MSINYSFGLESFADQRIHSKFISLLTQDKRGDLLDVGAGNIFVVYRRLCQAP